jgi:hypothetical protein
VLENLVGSGMSQKIESLKIRRRSDRVNVILTAAGRGDLARMKQALKVNTLLQAMSRFSP